MKFKSAFCNYTLWSDIPIKVSAPDSSDTNLLDSSSDIYSQLRESTNAMIRALTGGDITKEEQILKMDTWRALTELDAKAKEADDLRKATKKP